MKMDSTKNGRWNIPFEKVSRLRVKVGLQARRQNQKQYFFVGLRWK